MIYDTVLLLLCFPSLSLLLFCFVEKASRDSTCRPGAAMNTLRLVMNELYSAEADEVVPQCFTDLLEINERCVKETDMKMSED